MATTTWLRPSRWEPRPWSWSDRSPDCPARRSWSIAARQPWPSAAAWWYGDPSREMGVVGITGTDGKTTTSFLATAVLEAAGISTGLLTTAELKVGSFGARTPST